MPLLAIVACFKFLSTGCVCNAWHRLRGIGGGADVLTLQPGCVGSPKNPRGPFVISVAGGMRVCVCAGASAFEWQQEIGLNQARRTGEVADMDALLAFAVAEAQAAAALVAGSSETAQPQMLMAQVGCSWLSPVRLGPWTSCFAQEHLQPFTFSRS